MRTRSPHVVQDLFSNPALSGHCVTGRGYRRSHESLVAKVNRANCDTEWNKRLLKFIFGMQFRDLSLTKDELFWSAPKSWSKLNTESIGRAGFPRGRIMGTHCGT
jgi:hypothetical protein